MVKGIITIYLLCMLFLVLITGVARAAVSTYTDEVLYLDALSALSYSQFTEGFENDTVWAGSRSPAESSSVESQGIIWTSNHPATNSITSNGDRAIVGNWGVFDPDHGVVTATAVQCDVDVPPPECLYLDGVSGSRVAGGSTLYGIGGWFTGFDGANIEFVLDQNLVGLGKLDSPSLQPQFFGVIDTNGFRNFKVQETDGKSGQQLLLFADHFTFAFTSSCIPTGLPDTNCDNVDDDCNGVADDGYIVDAGCGLGLCRTNNTASSCVNGVETLCQPGLPGLENTQQSCTDTVDNDCDGDTDALDADCSGICIPTGLPDTNCDNVDDDCNGVADDGYVPDGGCGLGLCRTNNTPGSCINGIETLCQAGVPGLENTEQSCTDTVDNDCDGDTDALDASCSGVCRPSGSPDTDCDNIDDDCNGRVDDGYVVSATSCGVGECAATGQRQCRNGTEIDTCTAGLPVPEEKDPVCSDTLDNDCDGLVDSGDPGCTKDHSFPWNMYFPAILGTGRTQKKI